MEKIDFFEMSKNTPLKNTPNMPVGISSFEKISNLFKDFYFLKESLMLKEDDKNLFNKLKADISTELEVLKSLSTLVSEMFE